MCFMFYEHEFNFSRRFEFSFSIMNGFWVKRRIIDLFPFFVINGKLAFSPLRSPAIGLIGLNLKKLLILIVELALLWLNVSVYIQTLVHLDSEIYSIPKMSNFGFERINLITHLDKWNYAYFNKKCIFVTHSFIICINMVKYYDNECLIKSWNH